MPVLISPQSYNNYTKRRVLICFFLKNEFFCCYVPQLQCVDKCVQFIEFAPLVAVIKP